MWCQLSPWWQYNKSEGQLVSFFWPITQNAVLWSVHGNMRDVRHTYLSFYISFLIIIMIFLERKLWLNYNFPIICPIFSRYRMRGSSPNISSETDGAGGRERVSTATDNLKYGWCCYRMRKEASASDKSCLPWTTPPLGNNRWSTTAHSLSPLVFVPPTN